MKKFLVTTILLAFVLAFPVPTTAEVNVGVSISLPPMIVFASPPEMVVIPETYVYVVPDAPEEIFFYNGWWWRPWEGRWYRSRNYDSGWAYYRRVPSFYTRVPRGWRNDYRDHRWGGRPWNYQRIPHQEVRQNWSGWQKTNHWEKQQTWGVQGLKPRPQAKQQPRAVQEKSQARPQPREAAKPQQSRPQSQEAAKPQSRPQSGEVKQQQAQPQRREVQPQRSQPQQREAAPKQSKPGQGKPEKAQGKSDRGQGKPDRGEEDKQDRR